jgi:hypothetical protein
MTHPDSRSERVRARDAARRRLRRLTFAAVAGATALVGLFAGIAAKAVPGRKTVTTPTKAATTSRTATIPAAPAPIVPVEGGDSGAAAPSAPAAPSQAPVQSAAPPVVSSGGS